MSKSIILTLFLLFSQVSQASSTIGYTQYAVGGIVGTVGGLGLGHAIQGRWVDDGGWFYTIVEIAGVAVIVNDKGKTTCTFSGNSMISTCSTKYSDTTTAAAALVIATRLVEIVDVWWLPDNMRVGIVPDPSYPQVALTLKF